MDNESNCEESLRCDFLCTFCFVYKIFRLCQFLRQQFRSGESSHKMLLDRNLSDIGCAFLRDNLEG